MAIQSNLSTTAALDSTDLNAVRQAARQNSPEALKAAAQQFEALFMNMVMKSMRDATPQEGLFDSQQSRMYTSMLDQKVSESFAKRGIGLADALMRQLANNGGVDLAEKPVSLIDPNAISGAADNKPPPGSALAPQAIAAYAEQRQTLQPDHVKAFQQKLGAHAEAASRSSGIPAKFMLGQAALETGWGKKEIVGADGSLSHNLFGIKASGNWKGRVVEAATTEYIDGVAHKRVEKFRAYDSYAESFKDYANMLTTNPRYRNVIANAHDSADFAKQLQMAGYATDPNYAAKLDRIIRQSLAA